MFDRLKRRLCAAVLAAALFVPACDAHAYFERTLTSARVDALGGTFVAVADDATATWYNPAGLAGLQRFHILASYRRPYALGDVNESFAAVAVPAPFGVFGVSWFYRGLEGVQGENLVSLSFARDLKRTAEDASISVAATLDYARVSVSDRFNTSADAFSLGLSAHMRPIQMIGVGYSIRNVNESTLHLLDGGPGTELSQRQSWGLAWYWENRLVVSWEHRQDTQGVWRNHGGVELRLGTHVQLRSGLESTGATMGMGIQWKGMGFDVGVLSHESLGASYIFTLGYGPPPPVNPFAQAP